MNEPELIVENDGPVTCEWLRTHFSGQVVLVTGGRTYADAHALAAVLTALRPVVVIEGGHRPRKPVNQRMRHSADYLANLWCLANNVHCATVPALWDAFANSAGPRRNTAMARMRPDVVVAFPGGRGTDDMARKAAKMDAMVVRVLERA